MLYSGHVIIKTKNNRQIIDITNVVSKEIEKNAALSGICNVFALHTTCAITTADLDPGTDLDFLDFLDEITPDLDFRHPHNPEHAPDHILASIIGPSVSIPFINKKLKLGKWQKIVLVELNGPASREVDITIISN